jgi:DNA-binding NtrC family response regulator
MSSRRVLIIDSDAGSAAALQRLIASWHYDAVCESDETRALATAGETEPAVIVASSSGHSADDFSLLREIRAQQTETPIIWVTGAGSVEMALHVVQNEGAYHYFEKPVADDKLASCSIGQSNYPKPSGKMLSCAGNFRSGERSVNWLGSPNRCAKSIRL